MSKVAVLTDTYWHTLAAAEATTPWCYDLDSHSFELHIHLTQENYNNNKGVIVTDQLNRFLLHVYRRDMAVVATTGGH